MKYQPHKLTEKQKRRCRQILHSLDNGDLTFGWGNTEEGIDYWVTAIDKLRAKIKHGTSDGKPWQEPVGEPIETLFEECKCDMRTRLVGDGCEVCNPELAKELSRPDSGVHEQCKQPAIPEGYRKANADEWRRKDVKYWEPHQKDWQMRYLQGVEFNLPFMQTRYIVPIDPPLTDEDACVWPRMKVMVRDKEGQRWFGPYPYQGKNDGAEYPFQVNSGKDGDRVWKQARRATPEEIGQQLQ